MRNFLRKLFYKSKRPNLSSQKTSQFGIFQRSLSTFLIFLLFLTQSVDVSFFDRAEATTDRYRDIVSFIVDEDTYQELKSEIRRYATDIQNYLGSTRVNIFIIPADARPEVIAAHNEKLYYEGDGKDDISTLVGTVLIGNVPIPVVHKDGLALPSLYPYVDFDDKRFVYDTSEKKYLFQRNAPESSDIEIWHGVINPAVGRSWSPQSDIPKIQEFLNKTHEFYSKSGKFAPTGIPPRVFYYDGYNESASVSPANLYKYILFLQNAENLIYKRWSKYLLTDISLALKQFSESTQGVDDEFAQSIIGTDAVIGDESIDPEVLKTLPDIQTSQQILAYLKKFHEIINEKTLSDIQKAVYNAGRYNDNDGVRVDQGAIQMSIADELAMQKIKSLNDTIEQLIDNDIETKKYAKPLLILDAIYEESPLANINRRNYPNYTPQMVAYNNYYFGRQASTINSPEQCTIARGFAGTDIPFGQSILTEANAAYDITTTEAHANLLSKDTTDLVSIFRSDNYACFTSAGTPKTLSYFGDNTLLKAATSNFDFNRIFTDLPSGTSLQGFSNPIFSLGGMKETQRLPNPSINDCTNNNFQYTLLEPHTYQYEYSTFRGDRTCTAAYPAEWSRNNSSCGVEAVTNQPRYTCLTQHQGWSGDKSLAGAIQYYQTDCRYGTVTINGQGFSPSSGLGTDGIFGRKCIRQEWNDVGYIDYDNTFYHDRKYRTIPSLLKHISPTEAEIAAAEENGATPSLAIDIIRSVEFLTPRGGQAKIQYPNFFQAPTSSVSAVREWLRNTYDAQWARIISEESGRIISSVESVLNQSLGVGNLPSAPPIDWNAVLTDEVIIEIIQANRWLQNDVTTKYKNLVESSLSYSQRASGDILDNKPMTLTGQSYDIAYLGLAPFIPSGEDEYNDQEMQEYQYRLGELQGINFVESDPTLDDPATRAQAQCGPPEGVPLFQWPQAILCWLKTLVPPRIVGGSCGGNTIGLGKETVRTSPPPNVMSDREKLTQYYLQGTIVYDVPRTSLSRNSVLAIKYRLDRDASTVMLPPESRVKLTITKGFSGSTQIDPSEYKNLLTLSSSESVYTSEGSDFILSSNNIIGSVVITPTLTIPLPDGRNIEMIGDPLTIRITDEYVEINPLLDGIPVASIEATERRPVILDFTPKSGTGIDIPQKFSYTIDVYDDVNNELILDNLIVEGSTYQFPDVLIREVGNYRIVVTDKVGRSGEATLNVKSGPLAKAEFRPLSQTIVVGSSSLGILRFLDARDNLVSQQLLDINLRNTGGYFLDENGEKVTTLDLTTLESELIVSYGSDTLGQMQLDFSLGQSGSLSQSGTLVSQKISVIEKPRIQVSRSTTPKAGGEPIDMRIDLLDNATGIPVPGLSSLVTLDLPEGAGSFSGNEFPIDDGQSIIFQFFPGKKAGKHTLSIDIPGVGSTSTDQFSISAGAPMYITATLTDIEIEFSLRDRYGNIAPEQANGILKNNNSDPINISFNQGVYRHPRSAGYWRIEVPSLKDTTISYDDTDSVQTFTGVNQEVVRKTITGIPFYHIYVPQTVGRFNFSPDYNARYTVLAGDTYLNEGSQILYDTTPGSSQSLAVSTLLMSPYSKDNLVSVYPGGGWSVTDTTDMSLVPEVARVGSILRLHIADKVSQTLIADIGYPLLGLPISQCDEQGIDVNTCPLPNNKEGITFVSFPDTGYTIQSDASRISILDGSSPKISYTQTNGITLAYGVKLIPRPEHSFGRFVADVEDGGEIIGRILLGYDENTAVALGEITESILVPTLSTTHPFSRTETYGSIMSPNNIGYTIYRDTEKKSLEERIIGPNHIESFGALRELPAVGWQRDNRTLLSFSAGDTVGESTRWFHSYALVNLGDPVAHVDKGASGTESEGVDRTIGTQIAGSSKRLISSYKIRDMNKDMLEDMIIVYSDGFIELQLNLGGKFRKKQMIAYLPEINTRGLEFGDFTGDGFADIISLDNSGSLVLIDNSNRRLLETPIEIERALSSSSLRVTQYQIFDMDNDKRDDIVYISDRGELGILYGTQNRGIFQKNVLDQNLSLFLRTDPETVGGALRASVTPRSLIDLGSTGAVDAGVLNDEVFYQRTTALTPSNPEPIVYTPDMTDEAFSTLYSDGANTKTNTTPSELFVRSEYAPAYGIRSEKTYKNLSSSSLRSGDRIEVEIRLTNTTSRAIQDIQYLDILPSIFTLSDNPNYTTLLSGFSTQSPLYELSGEEYNFLFQAASIPAGGTIIFRYEVDALPISYGKMIVGRLENGLVGDDLYGDVGFETSNSCGADMLLWSSQSVRSYQKGTRSFSAPELPPSIKDDLEDVNNNGIPDSIENRTTEQLRNDYRNNSLRQSLGGGSLVTSNFSPSGRISIGFSANFTSKVQTIVKNLSDGLACGFGGGGCMSFPINWAPLAPGNAISVLGMPLGAVGEQVGGSIGSSISSSSFSRPPAINQGIPIFSALTRMDIGAGKFCFTVPVIWPVSPFSLSSSLPCNSANVGRAWSEATAQLPRALMGQSTASSVIGAGGVLGTSNSRNIIRVYVTPTLTLGMGTAICMGPANGGRNPLFPLISKGNCIVITKPMPVCKGDGSAADGDVRGISGLGTVRNTWNSQSCQLQAQTQTQESNASLTTDIVNYLKNPDTARLTGVYQRLSARGGRTVNLGGPLLKIGDNQTSGTAIDIGIDTTKPLTLENIVKVKNRRVAGFPEFIMDWVARQTDEFTNKLLTLPNLVIIFPRNLGQNAAVDKGLQDFLKRFNEDSLKRGLDDYKAKVGEAGNVDATKSLMNRTQSNSSLSKPYENWLDQKIQQNAKSINGVAGGVNQIRATYQFLGQLPFLRIEQAAVPINIPWPLPQELDRYARSLTQYKNEIARAEVSWCVGKTPAECADIKTSVGLGSLSSSIEQNIRRIEEWRNFPDKLQKYLTWKQRYMAQILCNVDAFEQILGGWYRDNGVRFRKWAEFYVLMKAILEGWQPFLDIFTEKDRQCSVCQNQRWDLKHWKYKLISAVIPQIPIIQFPRWPDIVLDLSDVRFGILIRVPDFRFNVSPIRLPDLPNLGLPGLPSASLSLPGLPVLPPVPNLPNLPDLPSFPKINFPNLPPPPKLPKIFGSVAVAINIFKLFTKIQCYLEKTSLVPEDYAGAIIAQRTDRQGTLPFDFLSIQFPQIAIPSLREIRVSTHVNYQLKSDFIVEFARSAVKPLNNLNTDFSKIPRKIAPDINIQTPANINKRIPYENTEKREISSLTQEILREYKKLQEDPDTLLDVDAFTVYLRKQMLLAGMDVGRFDNALAKARIEADELTEQMMYDSQKEFQKIREFIKAEELETKELEKLIDTMKNPPIQLADRTLSLAAYTSVVTGEDDKILDDLQKMQSDRQDKLQRTLETPPVQDRMIVSLNSRIDRLITASTGNVPSDNSSTAAGYAPKYQGIYILSPETQTQTRLFDYVDLLGEEDTVLIKDIDNDRDDDYIYLMDGVLYIKYSNKTTPVPIKDTDVTIQDLDLSLFPRAPNFFSENVASPGQIEVSLYPASPDDKNFRLEFFDKYLEFDEVKLRGEDDPNTPRVIIDMTVNDYTASSTGILRTPVKKSLESVSSPSGFILEGTKVDVLQENQSFALSAGRPLYTGNLTAQIRYQDILTSTEKDLILEKFSKYVFPESISGSIVRGKTYILTMVSGNTIEYSDDLRGMPLLPGTRIIHPNGSVVIFDPIIGRSTALLPNTEYRHLDLGNTSQSYTEYFPYPNGYYSAKLRSLTDDRDIHAGVILLAPLASLDRSSPVINLPSRIRIPVYQSGSLQYTDYIQDMSPFAVRVDPDVTQDTDNNGIFEDDFTLSGTDLLISDTFLRFGLYNTLGTRMVNIQATDAYGNSLEEPFEVEVYAPIPFIQNITTTGSIYGILDEPIASEPIHFFRVREGEGLSLVDPNPTFTNAEGVFNTSSFSTSTGIIFRYRDGTATVSETTGLPYNAPNLGTSFEPASGSTPMKILFRDNDGSLLFQYEILPPPNIQILSKVPQEKLTDPHLIVSLSGGYTMINAGLKDPSIPGGKYIVIGEKPVIALDRFGQIYPLDPDLSLSPVEKDGSLQVVARNGEIIVAEFLYKVDFFFTGK